MVIDPDVKALLTKMDERMDREFRLVHERMDREFKLVHERMDKIDERIAGFAQQVAEHTQLVHEEFQLVHERMDRADSRMEKLTESILRGFTNGAKRDNEVDDRVTALEQERQS